jgi:uncharacterized protein (DUF736 family)
MSDEKPKMEEVGALWENQSKGGKVYFSGKVNGVPVIVFQNTYKKPGEKSPDWRVYLKEDNPDYQRAESPAPRQEHRPAPQQEPETDDIPF